MCSSWAIRPFANKNYLILSVLSGVSEMAWDVLSGVTKTAWDVLFGVTNLCEMFCPGCQKIAWDVLSQDVLSYILCLHNELCVIRCVCD